MALDLETREQLISSVRRFVSERLVPLEDKVARDDLVPDDVVRDLRELGLFGMSIPSALLLIRSEVRLQPARAAQGSLSSIHFWRRLSFSGCSLTT